METVKNYILSLMGFSFIASLVCSLLPETAGKRTVRFVCGIILACMIVTPLKSCDPDFYDIFPESGEYTLYSNEKSQQLTQSILADKVCEIVGKTFETHGILDVKTEVVFGEDGTVSEVKISAVNDAAAKEAALLLGIPYEIMRQAE